MKRRYLPLALGLLLLSLLFLAGCQRSQDPAAFTADLVAAASSGNDKALAAYKGKTCQMNVSVAAVVRDEYVMVGCSDYVSIQIRLPSDELVGLQINDVIAVEGTVEDVDVKVFGGMYNVRMTVGSAHVMETAFELTGKVEEIWRDWDKEDQYYAAIWDSSIVRDRQICVYLPQGHDIQKGDTITAQGALCAPQNLADLSIAYLPNHTGATVFIMYEPNSVHKEAGE